MTNRIVIDLRASPGLDDKTLIPIADRMRGMAELATAALKLINYGKAELLQAQLNYKAQERRQREHQNLLIKNLTAPTPHPLVLTNGKIPRSDDGFSLLANALRLSDLRGLIDEMQQVLNTKPLDFFLKEYSKSDSFERMLSEHEIYDRRLKISRRWAFHEIYRVRADVEVLSLKSYIGGLRGLIESKANISQLRFIDLNLTAEEIRVNGLNPSPFEKRTPIARQSPSEFTTALKRLVEGYFERVDGRAEPNDPSKEMLVEMEKRHFESKIVDLLGGFYSDNPNMRISKKDAKEALKSKLGVGKRAIERIWKKFNEDREAKSGMIPIAEALSSIDLENFCQESAAIYGLKN